MKTLSILLLTVPTLFFISCQKKAEWVSSTQTKQWIEQNTPLVKPSGNPDAEVLLNESGQTIEGFGTCFNELGWTSLSVLSENDRESIMEELFSPGIGANFTICRMPVGANDFSRHWYSYNETEGDFEMKNFSIANDHETLIPFIKSALKYNPSLKIWASPWSPPSWMKYNKHYAMKNFPKRADNIVLDNGLKPGLEGKEGMDMFIQEDRYFKAYAMYFARFIEAYREQGIHISMVMPQNEFNSVQTFPSCTWTAAGLAKFMNHLVPQMKKLNVDVFFGTMERPNEKLADTILTDPGISKSIKGAGFQWAGKESIPGIHKRYPYLSLYQTEQECGNGKNDWEYCKYAWGLMKHYLNNGANAYMYWNTSLSEGGISSWGWKQNSLVSVDTMNRNFKFNYEYYLLKHVSHYVKPGAKRLICYGSFDDLLAFVNDDKSIVIMVYNSSDKDRLVQIKAGNKMISPLLKADSFNTFIIKNS